MKHTKIILAAILALTMTACSDTSTAEVTEEITESSVSETDSEVTTTEVTTTEEITTTTEEETTLAETTVSKTETELAAENLEGYYYECIFDEDIKAYSAEEFIAKGGTQEFVTAALSAVTENDNFKEAAAEMQLNPSGIYNSYFKSGSLLDADGNFTAIFKEGFCDDFDGDGKREAFIVCSGVGSTDGATSAFPYRDGEYAVFVNSDGAAEIVSYGCSGSCSALRYNGFVHMCTEYGENNGTLRSEIFALENGNLVNKRQSDILASKFNEFLLKETAPQAPGVWYIFWDNDAKEYREVANFSDVSEDGISSYFDGIERVEVDFEEAANKIVYLETE